MAVKRKLRIKKKNFTIFILANIIFIVIVIFLIHLIISEINSIPKKKEKVKNNNTSTKVNINNDDNKKNTETDEEKKLKQLDNINQKIDFFDMNKIDRYLAYKEKNSSLDNEKIVLYVNMNLDNEFYTNTSETKYLNKYYILVNKYYSLPSDYVPDNLEKISSKYSSGDKTLVKEAKEAFENMAADALKDDMKIIAMSAYRSYKYQVDLYTKYVKTDGKEAADTYSARAGFSEHQTGLCLDVYDGEIPYTSFEKTNEFKWMQENAYKYGFILRFPKDKTNETGYKYESWHYRYVGVEIAKYIHDNNISFEEYYVRFIENKK